MWSRHISLNGSMQSPVRRNVLERLEQEGRGGVIYVKGQLMRINREVAVCLLLLGASLTQLLSVAGGHGLAGNSNSAQFPSKDSELLTEITSTTNERVEASERQEVGPMVESSMKHDSGSSTDEQSDKNDEDVLSASNTAAEAKASPPVFRSSQVDGELTVPLPILVASLPKSGTTSIHRYFDCGKQASRHKHTRVGHIGHCFRENVKNGRPALYKCGPAERGIFSDITDGCYDPSVWDLQAFYESYPNATIVLGTRDSHNWIDSVDRYRFARWSLLPYLIKCGKELWPAHEEQVGDREGTI